MISRIVSNLYIPILILLMVIPFFISGFQLQLLIIFFINVMLTQSINILSGYGGQISLGQAGFFAVGAYASSILMIKYSVPLLLSIPVAILLSVLVGFILSIPAGRVKEFYLAMVTLGFGLILTVVIREWDLLGGFSGLSGIPSPVTSTLNILGFQVGFGAFYYLSFICMILVTLIKRNIIHSHIGRSFLAIKTNEVAASSIGLNPTNVKQMIYMVSAGVAGFAGALYAHYMSYIGYGQFDMMKSVAILVMAIIGGLGSSIGPFLGAAFETFIPHSLQIFEKYQLLIYGIILVLAIRYLPKGIAGLLKVKESYINLSQSEIKAIASQVNLFSEQQKTNVSKKVQIGNEHLLSAKEIGKSFGGLRALDNVSLNVRKGEIHGLIGPNGSGKSTLVNVITGAYTTTEGKVTYQQETITNTSMHKLAKKGIVRIFQDPRIIEEATVLENVLLGAQTSIKSGFLAALSGYFNRKDELYWTQKALQTLKLCGIEEQANVESGTLPYGTRRLIEIARAIISEPNVLILDEPAAGLSEVEVEYLSDLLKLLKKEGVSILIIDHHLSFLFNLIDSVTVLDYGKVIYQGNVQEMQKDEKVIEAYLGVV